MAALPQSIDVREEMGRRTLTVSVRLRGLWRVRLGLLIVRLGCRICGMGYKEED